MFGAIYRENKQWTPLSLFFWVILGLRFKERSSDFNTHSHQFWQNWWLLSDSKARKKRCSFSNNERSFLTKVSFALSHGSLSFAFHGSFFNHFLIGWFSSTANRNLWNKGLKRLPWRTKCRLPFERAWNCTRNRCQKWLYILFEATYRKNKQWSDLNLDSNELKNLFQCKTISIP